MNLATTNGGTPALEQVEDHGVVMLSPAVLALIAEAATGHPACSQRLMGFIEGKGMELGEWRLEVVGARLVRQPKSA